MAHSGRWDPPNFATASAANTNVSSYPSSLQNPRMEKQEGYNGVTVVKQQETFFTGSNAGASAILIPTQTANIGSASFADGTTIALSDLAADTMYEFALSSVSASSATLPVYVFKR